MTYSEFVRDRYARCEICPWWKGYVRDSYERDETIVAPLGFNIIYSIACELWMHMRMARMGAIRFANNQRKLRRYPTTPAERNPMKPNQGENDE